MRFVTSITIIPPFSVQAIAVPLLRRYTYDLPRRLPAHVTVLYPFVEAAELDTAAETLRGLCAGVPPFELTVAGYGDFPGVTYMAVRPSPALANLMQTIQAVFPDCVPYDGMFGEEAVLPHITVGVFNSEAKQRAAERPVYPPQTFTVDRLYVNIGAEEQILTWLVQDVVRLGGPVAPA